MTVVEEPLKPLKPLKKELRAVDLALAAARKRQSPRTGFVHLFLNDEEASDTVPLYENFCFVLALFRQKTGEAILEGKELIERLLPFQTPCGNFPIYLHDFPKCWDPLNPLKIAPIFLRLLWEFDSVLGPELKEKLETSLKRLLDCVRKRREEKPLPPLWENRYLACAGQPLIGFGFEPITAADWSEWLITLSLSDTISLSIPYNPVLESFIGIPPAQEKGEPRPTPIEWILAESSHQLTSPRLLKDHPDQIHCAPLLAVAFCPTSSDPVSFYSGPDGTFRILWKGSSLHSLAAFKASRIKLADSQAELFFDLNEEMAICRDDLFETALYCDVSSETQLYVENQKATLFQLGDLITLKTPHFSFAIRFEMRQGEGDFCGHIFRGNRPNQIACKGPRLYESYDWKIGLRTLRRSAPCQIKISIRECS